MPSTPPFPLSHPFPLGAPVSFPTCTEAEFNNRNEQRGEADPLAGPWQFVWTAYRFFFTRLLFLRVGTIEKVADVRSAGSIGAALVVVLILTFPAGVSVVLVRMRMFTPSLPPYHPEVLPTSGSP